MADAELAATVLAAVVRRAAESRDDALRQLAVAALAATAPLLPPAVPLAGFASKPGLARVAELAGATWTTPRRKKGPPRGASVLSAPLPGTALSVTAAATTLADFDEGGDGLFWLEDRGIFAARLGGATLMGNLCVIGRGRHTECCDSLCSRELTGCQGFHDPLRFPHSDDARALALPRNLRRAALEWCPSREQLDTAAGSITPERAAEFEAAAMHALLVALTAKRELANFEPAA